MKCVSHNTNIALILDRFRKQYKVNTNPILSSNSLKNVLYKDTNDLLLSNLL